MKLEEAIANVKPVCRKAAEESRRRWDSIAKPLNGLGVLEEDIVRIAAAQRTADVALKPRAIAVMCGDNGIVEEGVTQTGQDVTSIVAGHMGTGQSCVCLMASCADAHVIPVDVGMAGEGELPGVISRRVANGTKNFLKEPAMTREQTVAALETGIWTAELLKDKGVGLAGSGEMGIGNTTTSSAVACMLLGRQVQELTGRGAGLSDQGLRRKIEVIRRAIAVNRPDPEDPLDVLSKLGGFDIAGLCGIFLGGALYGIPVLIDGVISSAAALCAERLCPNSAKAMVASHVSQEPASRLLLEVLGKRPLITAGMHLGEGTGAVAAIPLLDMALAVYQGSSTFDETGIEAYQPLGGQP